MIQYKSDQFMFYIEVYILSIHTLIMKHYDILGRSSLVSTLTHEVGHTLGMSHSEIYPAIMWPRHRPIHRDNIIYQDDINAIQALYGKCSLRNHTSDHHQIGESLGSNLV